MSVGSAAHMYNNITIIIPKTGACRGVVFGSDITPDLTASPYHIYICYIYIFFFSLPPKVKCENSWRGKVMAPGTQVKKIFCKPLRRKQKAFLDLCIHMLIRNQAFKQLLAPTKNIPNLSFRVYQKIFIWVVLKSGPLPLGNNYADTGRQKVASR